MNKTLVILCDKCNHNRGEFIDYVSSYSAIAECKKCSNGVLVHFYKKQYIE